jgi:hypothetical protein
MSHEKPHTTKHAAIYTDWKGGGLGDLCRIHFEGMTLIDDRDLARLLHYQAVMEAEPLPSHVVDVLQLALKAISGPRGNKPKTQKAIDAWEAIRNLLATAPIERET